MEAWMLGVLVFVVVLVVGAALLSRKDRHQPHQAQNQAVSTASLPPKPTAQHALAQRLLLIEQPADLTTGATLCAVLAVLFNVLMLIVVLSTINVGIAASVYAVRAMVFGLIWIAGNQVLIAIVFGGRLRKFVLRRTGLNEPPEPKPPPAF